MEKWLVVAGIWSMCATCAVLFIRGATCSVARDSAEGLSSGDHVSSAIRD
ncbi:hypothetical protein [Paraburkholderia sp. DHOC27]|nr:hypothetical protein [Paraburkholderia sp. DHOC27]